MLACSKIWLEGIIERRALEMNWLTKKLSVSINRNIINKNENQASFKTGFELCEVTADELASAIQQGYAYAAQLEGGIRKASQFMYSSILSADFDGNVSPEEIGSHPLVKEGATIVYTTANDTQDVRRFRIVFALERKIEDPRAYSAAMEALALKLGSDLSVKDPARMFYGNSNGSIRIWNRGLSSATVEELVNLRYNAPQSEPRSERMGSEARSTRSKHTFSPDMLVRTASGQERKLRDTSYPTSLFCPFHQDANPSAYLVKSLTGQKGIHCSTCAMTYWPTWEPVFSTSFDAAAKRALAYSKKYEDKGPLAQFEIELLADGTFQQSDDNADMIPGLHRARVALLNGEHFPGDFPITQGVTYIKSPKGTGKTTFLRKLVENPSTKVLLVGHRQALLRSMAKNLGLHCYLDDKDDPSAHLKNRYAISLDSIAKVPRTIAYDFVLIDESEQVLAHLLSDTMITKRAFALRSLHFFAKKSRHIVALDADLGWASYRFLSRCRGRDDAEIVINEVKTEKGEMFLHLSQDRLSEQLLASIEIGHRCYVTSNRKGTIDKLHAAIAARFPSKRIISITSENSRDEGPQALLTNTASAVNYDVILTSPSVSTGVDFSFDGEAVFHVFGFFNELILTHFECDQQLSRVRDPLSVNVFVSAAQFHYDTELDSVRMDLLESRLANDCIRGFSDDGRPTYDPEDPLLDLAACVETQKRSSLNRLLDNFIAYKQADGWTIRRIEAEDVPAGGHTIMGEGKVLAEEAYIKALMSADQIGQVRAAQIQQSMESGEPVSSADRIQLIRYQIERFYRRELSPPLVLFDKRGTMRARVRLYEQITNPQLVVVMRDQLEHDLLFPDTLKLLRHQRYRATLLVRVLEMLKLMNNGEWNVDRELQKNDLHEFMEFVSRHKAIFETAFDRPIRRDFSTKALRSLNNILEHAGIKLSERRREMSGVHRLYYYGLDLETLDVMKAIAFSRSDRSEKSDLSRSG